MKWYSAVLDQAQFIRNLCVIQHFCQVTELDEFRASEQKPRILDTPGATDDESSAPMFEKRQVTSSPLQKGKQSVASGEVKKLSWYHGVEATTT